MRWTITVHTGSADRVGPGPDRILTKGELDNRRTVARSVIVSCAAQPLRFPQGGRGVIFPNDAAYCVYPAVELRARRIPQCALTGAKPAGGDQIPQRSDAWAAHLPER